jgi:exodeoxyribonuclease VII small subunit
MYGPGSKAAVDATSRSFCWRKSARDQRQMKSRFFMGRRMLNCFHAMSSQQKKAGPELNFEGAMERLEAIVEQMESGKMHLEDLIVRYEEGMKLVKICQERLASAEQRIEIITRNNIGKPAVKEFEPASESTSLSDSEKKENDGVTLF